MGMAASQARFLGLTARKNNVEFEGQQINQQRTTLSNQSANYYNDLLGMSVPVPPSVDDYTKTVYTFEDGALTNQITAMIAQTDGSYILSYLRTWNDDFSVVSASTSIVNNATGNYMVGSTTLRTLGNIDSDYTASYYTYNGKQLTSTGDTATLDGEDASVYTYTDDNGNLKYIYSQTDANGNINWYEDDPDDEKYVIACESGSINTVSANYSGSDEYLQTLSGDQLTNLMKEEAQYLTLLQEKYGTGDYMVRYIQDTTTGEWNPYFYKLSDLNGAIYDDNGNSQSNISCYTIGSETKNEEVKALKGVKIEKDSSGRYINVTIPVYNSDGSIDTTQNGTTYALTTTTATDQGAYDDAMNQYEYEKQEYDQAINEINAKIEIIQSQDKNLELRLKQLDTEQSAISTELDAVSQVIDKNVESSFKTFG